jgi:hypothetical protein
MIENILHYWFKTLYLHPVVVCCCIYVLLQLRREKNQLSKHFKCYVISLLCLFISGDIIYSVLDVPRLLASKITEVLNNTFTIIETWVFYFFFSTIVKSEVFKTFLKICLTTVIIAGLVINFLVIFNDTVRAIFQMGFYFEVLHGYTIIGACLFYFYEVYRKNDVLDNNSSFLAFIIFSYSIISSLYFVLFVQLNLIFYAIFQVLSAIHYILLISVCLGFILPIKRSSQVVPA